MTWLCAVSTPVSHAPHTSCPACYSGQRCQGCRGAACTLRLASSSGCRRAQYGSWDSFLSLCGAFFVNAAILILAAAAFHYGASPQPDVGGIAEAYQLLAPALGSDAARILFGVALLACGQNSAITGTLAGQVGFTVSQPSINV